eukprot:CAMPEP_0183773860 /NCGR_PEP_ID=MMETSP0739-20130205/40373_1 /TAXON_ID=385413 /ORGANISM="Thalassiosira miniscula, Strain CCMP1093" /LENGTH=44 /DNA_ID= /DNA_START= /DNA_END= /DNA_ORIENTATION=
MVDVTEDCEDELMISSAPQEQHGYLVVAVAHEEVVPQRQMQAEA